MRKNAFKILVLLLLSVITGNVSAKIWYVGTWPGKEDVKTTITDALSGAANGDQIWVSGGEYPVTSSIQIKEGVSMYGGFAGTESTVSERAMVPNGKPWEFVNQTKITGTKDIFILDTDNGTRTYIDGFVMETNKQGRGINFTKKNVTVRNCIVRNCGGENTDGGGIQIKGTDHIVEYCLIENNKGKNGGGLFIENAGGGDLIVRFCEIKNNTSGMNGSTSMNSPNRWGGGIFNFSGKVYSCLLEGNSATAGGAILVRNTGSYFSNCIIVGNSAKMGGGIAIHSGVETKTISNCIVANNTASQNGGGVYFSRNNQTIYNSIFYNNKLNGTLSDIEGTVKYSVQNSIIVAADTAGMRGVYNIAVADSATLFASDWRPADNFPGVDKGQSISFLPAKDYEGKTRIANGKVDIGPFEIGGHIIRPDNNWVFYVKADAVPVGEIGSSWQNAFPSLEEAIKAADEYVTNQPNATKKHSFWVAGGEYPITATIQIQDGVSFYGGFAGTESSPDERAVVTNGKQWEFVTPTTISGSKVIFNQTKTRFNDRTFIDGFIITNNKNGQGINLLDKNRFVTIRNSIIRNCGGNSADGGGIQIKGTDHVVEHCLVENNKGKNGAGIYVEKSGEGDAPIVRYCAIKNNSSGINGDVNMSLPSYWGGGIFTNNGVVYNCLVDGNEARAGGGILIREKSSYVSNCIIINNSAQNGAGVTYDARVDPQSVSNCIIANNNATKHGGGAYFSRNNQTIYNSIFYNNKLNGTLSDIEGTVTYSVQNSIMGDITGVSGTNNMQEADSTALFGADWTPAANFPGVDKGISVTFLPEIDYDGNPRIVNTVDIGPYEYFIKIRPDDNAVFYVKADATGTAEGYSWENALTSLGGALSAAQTYISENPEGKTPTIWVAGGDYQTGSVNLVDGVSIYGGFAGTETSIEERQKVSGGKPWEFVSSSVILGTGRTGGNVLFQPAHFKKETVLDGLTVKNGLHGIVAKNNLTIRNCIVAENGKAGDSGTDGGGIRIEKGSNNSVVEYSLIENNKAKSGGGIAIVESGAIVRSCLIRGNEAFTGNSAVDKVSGWGGGVFNQGGKVFSCDIVNNRASVGAGVYVRIPSSYVENCIITHNEGKWGGGVSYDARGSNTAGAKGVANNIIAYNNATEQGGGVCFTNKDQVVYNSIFWKNSLKGEFNLGGMSGSFTGCAIDYSIVDGDAGDLAGGNIFTETDSSKLFTDMESGDWSPPAGFIGVNKGLSSVGTSQFDYVGNRRKMGEVAMIKDIGPFEKVEISTIFPDDNGIFYVRPGGSGAKTGASWEDALASISMATSVGEAWAGATGPTTIAKVWVMNGNYPLDETVVLYQNVSLYGGFNGTETKEEDRKKVLGGAAWEFQYSTVLDGQNTIGVFKQLDHYSAEGSVVDGFTVKNGKNVNGGGAEMKNFGKIQNCQFIDCEATGKGGGIFYTANTAFDQTCLMSGCYISGCKAANGGGLSIDGYVAKGYIENSVIENNTAQKSGGGIFTQGSFTVRNCIIRGNEAKGTVIESGSDSGEGGGGIYARVRANIVNNLIIDNKSARGAGIFVIYDNQSSEDILVLNNTIGRNISTAAGGGFLSTVGKSNNGETRTVTLQNNIFWDNDNNNIFMHEKLTYQLNNNAISGQYYFVSEGKITYKDCMPVKDSVSNFGKDYVLLETSEFIDKGLTHGSLPEFDLKGNPRVNRKAVDLGVYEFRSPSDNFAIDYINETLSYVLDNTKSVEASRQEDPWSTTTFTNLIEREDTVVYVRLQELPGEIVRLNVPGRGYPTLEIDFAGDSIRNVASGTTWDIATANTQQEISSNDLTTFIDNGGKNNVTVKQPASEERFKTDSIYQIPGRRPAPTGIGLDYVKEELTGIPDKDILEIKPDQQYMPLDTLWIGKYLSSEQNTSVNIRYKYTDQEFASAAIPVTLVQRAAKPTFKIDYAQVKTKEVVSTDVEYDTVITLENKKTGTGTEIDLIQGKTYWFRVAASQTNSRFASEFFELNVPVPPVMGEVTLNYIKEELVGLPKGTLWDYNNGSPVTGESATASISGFIPVTGELELKIYVTLTDSTFASDTSIVRIPAREDPPQGLSLDYVQESFFGMDGLNLEARTTGGYTDLSNASIGGLIPTTLEETMYVRSKATETKFASKEASFSLKPRPAQPTAYTIDYPDTLTKEIVPVTIEYDTAQTFGNPIAGADQVASLIPGTTCYFRIKASQAAETFASLPTPLEVPKRPTTDKVALSYFYETLVNLPEGAVWSYGSVMDESAREKITYLIPEEGELELNIYKPGDANTFHTAIQKVAIPARPDAPEVHLDFYKEVLTSSASDLEMRRNISNYVNFINGFSLKPYIPREHKAVIGVRSKVQNSRFASKEKIFTLYPRPVMSQTITIDFINEMTVEDIAQNIEYSLDTLTSTWNIGEDRKIELEPGLNYYFRVAPSEADTLFASDYKVLEIPYRPVISIEDMEVRLSDGPFIPEMRTSWSHTPDGIILESDDPSVAVIGEDGQTVTPMRNGECYLIANFVAKEGEHYAAEEQIARLKVGLVDVGKEEEQVDVNIQQVMIADGRNSTVFKIPELDGVQKKLIIYNRAGKVIHKADNYGDDYDMGNLKSGTYYYILFYEIGGRKIEKKGYVEIIR